ncbi:MAG: hypothetical protein WCJ35_27765 [Planctomycetota bacterium]
MILPVRLLGMGVSGLNDMGQAQGMLFGGKDREKHSQVDAVADRLKEKFGDKALRRGSNLERDEKPKPS